MNTLRLFTVVCFLSLLVASCQSKKETGEHHHHEVTTTGTVAELEKQILAVHDSMMPQMNELLQFQKDVAAKVADSDGLAKEKGLQISQQLKNADEAMMDWMHQYKGDTLTQLSQEDALAYLKIQQEKVQAMRDLMRKSLTEAENYLRK